MKGNKITALVIMIAMMHIFTVGSAQNQFTIGVKAGANGSNYKDLTKSGLGIDAGIFMRFGNSFFFQPEVKYSFKSSTFENAVNEFSDNVQLKQHFVSVPALLGYHFINNENFKFHLTLGPRFDFKISDNMTESDWQFNNLLWGGQVGLGFDFWRFTFDVNYCIAAANFHKENGSKESQSRLTNVVSASIGFKFIK